MPCTIMEFSTLLMTDVDKADILRAFVAVPPHARCFMHGAATNGGREPGRFLRYYFWVQNFTSRHFIVEAQEQLP